MMQGSLAVGETVDEVITDAQLNYQTERADDQGVGRTTQESSTTSSEPASRPSCRTIRWF
jgi:hypothetical protein